MHATPPGRLVDLVCGAALALSALVAPPAGAAWTGSAERIHNHPTWIYTPALAASNGKHPLMLVLHGCDQGFNQLKDFGNLTGTAEDNAIVLAVPSVGNKFFGPSKCWDYNGARDDKQHIAELVALARALLARPELAIDPRHVYILGLSSGAAMALDVACKAPDLFAGVGAVAGPSVGSDQNKALVEDRNIPASNVADALRACRALAGANAAQFERQIASIAFGDMDLNGTNEKFRLAALPTEAERRKHAGQIAVVSVNWSADNVAVLQQLYGAGELGAPQAVMGGLGTERVAAGQGRPRVSLLTMANVGHAWPAGTGQPNVPSPGGLWVAQSGIDYFSYAAGWLISNSQGAPAQGLPEVSAQAAVREHSIALSGRARDPDGSVQRLATALLKDGAGGYQVVERHDDVALDAGGAFADLFERLADGRYKVQATATDNANNSAGVTLEAQIGQPPPPLPCFIDNNYNHVQKGRALQCGNGYACAKGSGDNLGLFNLFVTSAVEENPAGFFRKGVCRAP